MDAASPSEVGQLGAAGEPVGEHDRVGRGRAVRGQQGGFGDGHRDVVVAAFHTEVACEPAAPAHPGQFRARPAQQRLVGMPSHDRRVVAVRLGEHSRAPQARRLPAGRRRQHLGERPYRPRQRPCLRWAKQLQAVGPQGGGARRFQADHRHARVRGRP